MAVLAGSPFLGSVLGRGRLVRRLRNAQILLLGGGLLNRGGELVRRLSQGTTPSND